MKALPATIACALTCVSFGTASAYSIQIDGQALINGAVGEVEFHEILEDAGTSLSFSTGLVSGVPEVASTGSAFASANIATGEIKLSGTGSGVVGLGLASASLTDLVTFSLPQDMDDALITFTMSIEGTATPGGPTATARLITGGVTNHEFEAVEDLVGIVNTVTVLDGTVMQLNMLLSATTGSAGTGIARFFDLSNTAALAIDLPEGVSFSSESGVLLTVPEPGTVTLLALALCGIAATRFGRDVSQA